MMRRISPRQQERSIFDLANGSHALFAVMKAKVFALQCRPLENARGEGEIEATLSACRSVLGLIPFEHEAI
jgi:hypothetical protein